MFPDLNTCKETLLTSKNLYYKQFMFMGFIDVFSRKAAGFHGQAKLFKLNPFFKVVKTGRQNCKIVLTAC